MPEKRTTCGSDGKTPEIVQNWHLSDMSRLNCFFMLVLVAHVFSQEIHYAPGTSYRYKYTSTSTTNTGTDHSGAGTRFEVP